MLNVTNFRSYQTEASNFIFNHPESMLWLDMGLGKTVATLTAYNLLLSLNVLKGCLIVAPLRVCKTVWSQEAQKWEHLRHLTFSRCYGGDAAYREKGLHQKADFYLVNYENLDWLFNYINDYYFSNGAYPPFDAAILDEITKMKNSTSERSKAFHKLRPYVKYCTGLTGSPSPNGLEDLHGQYLAIDNGLRLGEFKTAFRQRFFYQDGYSLTPFDDSENRIMSLVQGITLNLENKCDIEMVFNKVVCSLKRVPREKYQQMEDSFFLEFENGVEIEADNEAAKYNKCLQIANGAVYTDESRNFEIVHDEKLEALDDILEEANGKPVLLAYSFRSDAKRITERYPNVINFSECQNFEQALEDWKTGKYTLGIGHPASMGHGIDGLQDSCHILVWFGLNWSLELFSQFNARVKRTGQKNSVICHLLMVEKTLDFAVWEALQQKEVVQTNLREIINRYKEEKL